MLTRLQSMITTPKSELLTIKEEGVKTSTPFMFLLSLCLIETALVATPIVLNWNIFSGNMLFTLVLLAIPIINAIVIITIILISHLLRYMVNPDSNTYSFGKMSALMAYSESPILVITPFIVFLPNLFIYMLFATIGYMYKIYILYAGIDILFSTNSSHRIVFILFTQSPLFIFLSTLFLFGQTVFTNI